MKIIKNEFGYYPLYEVDDLLDFDEDAKIEDFEKINYNKICLVDDLFNLFILELNKNDKILNYKKDIKDIFLILSNDKYYISNWSGKFMNVLDTSVDDYEIEMLDKIRKNDIIYFTTQF